MEKHFLEDFVLDEQRTPSEPWYNADGDCIVYQKVDEAIVADRIDNVLTLYRSAITQKVIGFQIKGVAALAKKYGFDGVLVERKESGDEVVQISLTAILLAAYGQGPMTIGRRLGYTDAFESSPKGSRLPARELCLN